ncbi:hypothetical protein L1049_013736 [Liquidambar formosana]|uniref:Uncharacterized protein n=1 Tax=Liquidambar formosana TaxID=63359 RepID=A0AAP0RQN8_LIQFO
MGIYGGHRKDIYGALHGEMTTNTSDIMGISGTRDQTDGFGEVFREDIAHQNQDLQVRLGLYIPITGNGSSNSSTAGITTTDMMMVSRQLGNQAQPAQLGSESQSRLFEFIISKSSNCSESSVLPPQATQVSSLSQATISSHGFGSRYLGGEGPSNGPPGPNIGASLEWSRPTPWGPRAISDFPYTQMRFSEEGPWGQQDTLVRPELQLAPAPQGGPPTFDAASFNESSPPQSHQAEPSGQFFWNTQPLSLLDIQQPDLALQL